MPKHLPGTIRIDTELGTEQIAWMTGASSRTVTKWIDQGKLRGHRLPGDKGAGSGMRRVRAYHLLEFCLASGLPIPPALRHLRPGCVLATAMDDMAAFESGFRWPVKLPLVCLPETTKAMTHAMDHATTMLFVGSAEGWYHAELCRAAVVLTNPTCRTVAVIPPEGTTADLSRFDRAATAPLDWGPLWGSMLAGQPAVSAG